MAQNLQEEQLKSSLTWGRKQISRSWKHRESKQDEPKNLHQDTTIKMPKIKYKKDNLKRQGEKTFSQSHTGSRASNKYYLQRLPGGKRWLSSKARRKPPVTHTPRKEQQQI